MRAMLLAAGYGSRLRPLTNTVPKCLVPIRGRPLLGIWLESLSRARIREVMVNSHYLAQQVASYIASSPYRDNVTLVHEPELLGTAATLITNLAYFGDQDGLLIHADNYCEADMPAFIQAHRNRPAECLMTMMTFLAEEPSSCGIVELDNRNVVVGFHEKVAEPPGRLANGAIYAISPALMAMLATEMRGAKDFSTEVLPRLLGRIYTHHTDRMLVDIGTPEAYQKLNS